MADKKSKQKSATKHGVRDTKVAKDLATSFAGLQLRSPLIVASGPASHDVKQVKVAEAMGASAVVLKTVCSEKYEHMRRWPRPRYKLLDWDRQIEGRSTKFTLYSYEQGYSGTLQDYWDFIKVSKANVKIPIIGSAFADVVDDWIDLAGNIERSGADAVELDISSPHRPGSLDFENTFVAAIKAVVHNTHIPVLVKLAPGPDVVNESLIAQDCGAAAVTLCNRLRGIDIDIESQRPILHGNYAGVGGPWTKYYNFRYVSEVASAAKIPISASSGVMNAEDVIKYILLGATTVQILSVIMVNGWEVIRKIEEGIRAYVVRNELSSLHDICGIALKNFTAPDKIARWSGESKRGPRNDSD